MNNQSIFQLLTTKENMGLLFDDHTSMTSSPYGSDSDLLRFFNLLYNKLQYNSIFCPPGKKTIREKDKIY